MKAKLKSKIENCIEQHGRLKNVYFFSPGGAASQRRNNEARWADQHPSFNFKIGKKQYSIKTNYTESCKNVYYSLSIIVDDETKNITALKKLVIV